MPRTRERQRDSALILPDVAGERIALAEQFQSLSRAASRVQDGFRRQSNELEARRHAPRDFVVKKLRAGKFASPGKLQRDMTGIDR